MRPSTAFRPQTRTKSPLSTTASRHILAKMPEFPPSFTIQIPSNAISRDHSDHDQTNAQPVNQSNTELQAAASAARDACHQLLHILSQNDINLPRSGPNPSPRPIRYLSLQDYFRLRDRRRERKVVRIIKDTTLSSRARARLYPRAFEVGGILRPQYWYLKDSGGLTDEEWKRVAPRRRSGRIRR